jgi:beta-glucanase (GH16 family)
MHKKSFTYGRLDASIKTPEITNGMWPAFWLMGENFDKEGWPECGEIDIMELGSAEGIKGGTQEGFLTRGTHWGSNSSDGAHPAYSRNDVIMSNLSEDFHLYTMIWDESYIRMYLDLDKDKNADPYYEIRIDNQADGQGEYHIKDYFEGTVLNPEFWNIEINSYGGGNHELQAYCAENVSIDQEPESNKRCLVLTAKKQQGR